jgi:methionyl aminopeptidase
MVAKALTEADVAGMRTAGALAAQVLDMIGEYVVPGVTTGELDAICHRYIVEELDSIPAPLNYSNGSAPPFPKSICTSVNHVVCHGIPSDKKQLKSGDVLNIDVTVIKNGYHGDTSKMFCVGKVSPFAERLIKVTQECLYLGIEAVRPGVPLSAVGRAIQRHAEANHFSVVREFCGHGIGTTFHDEPQVLHYVDASEEKRQLLGRPVQMIEEGMTFTIEPMINAGERHVKILPDQWTVVTKDHKLSAQWEHTILVTATGAEVLTRRSEEQLP